MERIKVIRKGDGTAYQNPNKQFVFVKGGVHFALSPDQMQQMSALIAGLTEGTLLKIDPNSADMAHGD